MEIHGLTLDELENALDMANVENGGNLIWNHDPESIRVRSEAYRLTLRVADSRGPGAKMGQSGRRTVSADYYAHREFMAACYILNPETRIVTAMETYTSADEFQRLAPAVANRNVGSLMYPQMYGDL